MMEISRNDTDLAERKAHSKVIGIEGIEKFEEQLARLREAQKNNEDICISYQNVVVKEEPMDVRLFSCDNFTDEEYYLLAYGLPAEIFEPITQSLVGAFNQLMNNKITQEQYDTIRIKSVELLKTYRGFYREERFKLNSHGNWQY